MKKVIISLVLGATYCLMLSVAQANTVDLMQVYQDALKHDPTYRNAIATYRDKREALPQAQAQLLPVIATDTTSQRFFKRTRRDVAIDPTAAPAGFNKNKFNYNETTFGASLDQPIFNFAYWAQLSGARAAVRSAYADLQDAKQSLITRTAAAYFNVLLAQDTLRFTLAEKRAVAQQLEQTKQRFRVGLDAITSVYDAQASYDSITAQAIQARNGVENSFEQLREITGVHYQKLASFKSHLPLVRPDPANVEQWVNTSLKNNYGLISAREQANFFREGIKQQFAGHLPTLDAIGSYGYTTTSDPSKATAGQGGQETAVGVELKFPIFNGGAITSLTRQADAQYQEAYTLMEQTQRATVSSTRQTYNDITAGISTIKADQQTIKSQNSSLEGTIAAFKVGTRTIVDVLDAQKLLTQAQKQYASDQYSYINNTLSLKQLGGMLSPQDLAKINSWLVDQTSTSDKKTAAHHNKRAKRVVTAHKTAKKKARHGGKPSLLARHAAAAGKTSSLKQQLALQDTNLHTDDYRLQLASFTSEAHAKNYIAKHQLGNAADVAAQRIHQTVHYRVLYGHYTSHAKAIAAIKNLPTEVQDNHPWVILADD